MQFAIQSQHTRLTFLFYYIFIFRTKHCICSRFSLFTSHQTDTGWNYNNMTSLSTDAQIRYLIQWFNEWSELQRSDFLPILTEKYANKVYMNGIVNNISGVNCQDKPMSLFECRVIMTKWFWSKYYFNIFFFR